MISRFAKSFLILVTALFVLTMLGFFHPPTRSYMDPWTDQLFGDGLINLPVPHPTDESAGNKLNIPVKAVQGGVIMEKLGNATANTGTSHMEIIASYCLLLPTNDGANIRCLSRHTMTLRYPENPTNDEREALESYFHLFSRLYPCGECASEFQALLKKYPPQTSSRRAASLWLCAVHNEVNLRLGKKEFDCAHLDEEYDCGCGDAPINAPKIGDVDPMDLEYDPSKDEVTGADLIRGGR
ncbi:hypothetical protein D9757_006452 [Collybiopsis confluens]|uniref:Sulfhydryl oxidase n=1 Tax=Collybiopsis confluens TaxID=2823264 RepID=A0A8H5HK43_9AGAR|nr:hypothetical protein D9757_006452 [Collybiopsis confluens]